ncbi:MAG TPA: primosomal replication protein N [Burkholderiaceae bacterium]|nr:primosomal replication protein N [Burkholderiaceae bacterium]
MNRVLLNATLIERTALRYTPAGVAVIEAQLEHQSDAIEAGVSRRLQFPFGAIALGGTAKQLANESLGSELSLSGFLAPRSRRSARLLVHVQQYSRLTASGQVDAKQNESVGTTEHDDGNSAKGQ